MEKTLETPTELAKRVGLPVSRIRYLIKNDFLEHVFMTPSRRNPLIPAGAWERCLEANTVKARKIEEEGGVDG